MTASIRVGIAGGAGYTGGELIRILLHHPSVRIAWVQSASHAGEPLSAVHADLIGDSDLRFSPAPASPVDAVILCMGHGQSRRYLDNTTLDGDPLIIDLGQDFRLAGPDSAGFIYGLPELQRERIRTARRIANPGCFATAIQLALLPLAAAGRLSGAVHVSAITGSTGAGQAPGPTTHFSWRSHNVSLYKAFTHQHLGEIGQSLDMLQNGYGGPIRFLPYRGNFTRGILASVYTDFDGDLAAAEALYDAHYEGHPFVHRTATMPDVKQVVNTNKCLLHLVRHDDQLLIVSVIDNLVKGASGQAVQNLNLMTGRPETEGLLLKPVAF